MSRPRTVKHGVKLNLYLPRALKNTLLKLATKRKRSAAQLVSDWVREKSQIASDIK